MSTNVLPTRTATDAISYDDLYARWEKGNWRSTEIDFSEDARQWQEVFTEFEREAALWNYALFFWGEDAVADGLSPYIDAAPLEEQKYFLTTQQVDEARHAVFFSRFMSEVAGVEGGGHGARLAAIEPKLTWGFRKTFECLEKMCAELRRKPTRTNLAAAVTLYHLVIEATLAQPGQHFITSYLEQRELLPGFRAGMENVAADEQRHIGFGVKLLADLCRDDPDCRHAVADMLREVIPYTAAVLVPPGWDRRYTEVFGFTLEEIGAEGAASLETKLRSAGLPMDELPGPPIFSPGMDAMERAKLGQRLVYGGILGEKTGPPRRDADTMAALFQMLVGGIDKREAPSQPGTIQWDFADADPWHLVVANGDTHVAPGRVEAPTVTIACRYEDWTDLLGGREHPLKLAAMRRLRPKGDLRWMWRARRMFPLLSPVAILRPVPERSDLERRAVELLQRLIGFDTVNPPGNEAAAQDWLRELLEAAGFECELLAAVEGRPNLIARLRSGSDGPALCLLGHVDTVLADPAEWSVDPWSGELRDGFVWGRGALDMKSQVAAEAAAAIALVEEGWRPESGELLLVFTADEETGALHGAQWLCARHPDRVRCDFVVNEGAGAVYRYEGRRVYPVCVAEKGVFRFTLVTEGRAGHASVPRIGENALARMGPLLDALRERHASFDLTREPELLLRSLGLDPSDPDAALAEIEAADPGLAVLVEPMLGVSMTPTILRAGEKINVIPSHAELQVDCRVPPGQGEEEVRRALREVIGANGYRVEFGDDVVVGNRSPTESPLMDSIRGFVQREDPGAEVTAIAMPGFSDSHWWRAAFPDCVVYGFFPQRAMDAVEAYSLIHAADERIPVEDLGLAVSFYSELIVETLR